MEENTEKKLLIAEDDPDLREALETVLGDAGYTLLVATDGEEALTLYQNESPDMLMIDLNMPKKSGMEFLREVRSDLGDETTPITILTAHAGLDHVANAATIGGMKTDFLSKADKSLAQILEHVKSRIGAPE